MVNIKTKPKPYITRLATQRSKQALLEVSSSKGCCAQWEGTHYAVKTKQTAPQGKIEKGLSVMWSPDKPTKKTIILNLTDCQWGWPGGDNWWWLSLPLLQPATSTFFPPLTDYFKKKVYTFSTFDSVWFVLESRVGVRIGCEVDSEKCQTLYVLSVVRWVTVWWHFDF